MVKNTINAPKEQKEKRAKLTSYAEHLAAARDDLIAEEADLNQQKQSLVSKSFHGNNLKIFR